jgi:dihydrofolate reductase / thymidylate synthase
MRFNVIVAMDSNRGIGNQNNLPWVLKGDMDHFKSLTSQLPQDNYFTYYNVVVMGRKTWDSIPQKFRPLPNRINIILSSQTRENVIKECKNQELVYIASDWQDVFNIVNRIQNVGIPNQTNNPIMINDICVIGGQKIYESAINHPYCDKIYLTEIYHKYETDTVFPKLSDGRNKYELVDVSPFQSDFDTIIEQEIYYRYYTYQNATYFMETYNINENVVNGLDIFESHLNSNFEDVKLLNQLKRRFQLSGKYRNREEEEFLDFIKEIKNNGIERNDRTGVGTLSIFGKQLKYNLRDTFPMMTTKKMFLRGIFEELMMYLRGQTDNKILQSKNIHIWDGNTSREFLDKKGLTHFVEGDMGATYGFNFKYYGADYEGCNKDYSKSNGFDQLNYAIDLIKNDPTSRRILINLWNPCTLDQVALPSCLCQYQFYVDTVANELNLQIYLRSSDVFLANNWNTCTGALLVHMICNLEDVNLTPGDLSVVTGDTHLYSNHMESVDINLDRTPRPFPKLIIKNQKKCIEDFTWDDLVVHGYKPYPGIKAEMAV